MNPGLQILPDPVFLPDPKRGTGRRSDTRKGETMFKRPAVKITKYRLNVLNLYSKTSVEYLFKKSETLHKNILV